MSASPLLQYLDRGLVEAFKRTGRDELFLRNYVANAVLSWIEEREQELIRDMRYDAWVRVDAQQLLDRVSGFVERYLRAHGFEPPARVFEEGRELDALAEIICWLNERGIYDDGVSRYLAIKGFGGGDLRGFVRRRLEEGNLEVRSRFIEMAFYLARVRQRFRDNTVFDARPLVSRVFAFFVPREMPVGTIEVEEAFEKVFGDVYELMKAFFSFLRVPADPSEYKGLLRLIAESFFKKFKEWYKNMNVDFRFYDFQVEGIKAILEEAKNALQQEGKRGVVLEARTGSGKTEAFLIASILAVLAYRLTLLVAAAEHAREEARSPLVVITYPRRALATDQFKRLLRYVYIFNNSLKDVLSSKLIIDRLKIHISMNFAEVRYIDNLRKKIKKEYANIPPCRSGPRELDLIYTKVLACREDDGSIALELPYVFSPDETRLRAKIKNLNYNNLKYSLKHLWWRKSQGTEEVIDFVRAFKELVYEEPGDIHVTILETLRRDLLQRRAQKIFGAQGHVGPLIFVIDEVHLYTGVFGARAAYLLDRVLSRVKLQTGRRRGAVFVCLSATIPGGEDFVRRFLGAGSVRSGIKPRRTIPMGGEYIYVIVPALGVEHLSVSIQSVMVLHTNMPAYPLKGGRREKSKKTLAFADSLDVVYRLHDDLHDAMCEKRLQDLRNARSKLFYGTLTDLNDRKEDVREALTLLSGFEKLNSWREGELWWPYSLEDGRGGLKPAVYTGREKQEIVDADLVVTDSALEVGVDYDDVAVIYQHGAPLTFAALIQRAGRGGRLMKDNPLVRAAIAVMLSPYLPTQAAMLELLLRSGGSLQSLLERERLPLAVENRAVIEQSIVEAILDYLTVKDYLDQQAEEIFESEEEKVLYIRPGKIKDFEKFIEEILRENDLEIRNYLKETFKDRLDVERKISEILSELKEELSSVGENG
ncbi:MAG: DEAD/DEAH box helicase [Thermofilum sp.]|nr:DEAD/DEAH box helicase [Thermofilum sp.]